ncbi:MAG: maltotransferase domain-containing protein, partial [Bacteroidales bacterium]
MKETEGRKRVIIENVNPEIDCGNFPVRRVTGEKVQVSADIFADGHNEIKTVLLQRKKGKHTWEEIPMTFISNDHWEAEFKVNETGWYEYTLQGWVDHFASWQKSIKAKYEANQDVSVELQIGRLMMEKARKLAIPTHKIKLDQWIAFINDVKNNPAAAVALVLSDEVSEVMYRCTDRKDAATYEKTLLV